MVQDDSKFCPHCGQILALHMVLCGRCGAAQPGHVQHIHIHEHTEAKALEILGKHPWIIVLIVLTFLSLWIYETVQTNQQIERETIRVHDEIFHPQNR